MVKKNGVTQSRLTDWSAGVERGYRLPLERRRAGVEESFCRQAPKAFRYETPARSNEESPLLKTFSKNFFSLTDRTRYIDRTSFIEPPSWTSFKDHPSKLFVKDRSFDVAHASRRKRKKSLEKFFKGDLSPRPAWQRTLFTTYDSSCLRQNCTYDQFSHTKSSHGVRWKSSVH